MVYFHSISNVLSNKTFAQGCLERGDYEFVLDRACSQFEPDDPIYIRVTRKTYDHVNERGQFAALRSTRHFGPMTLHLVLSKRLDDLLLHFITKEETDAAADLVRLFHSVEGGSIANKTEERHLIEVQNQPDLILSFLATIFLCFFCRITSRTTL